MRYGPGFCLYEFPRGTPSTQLQLHVWLAVGYLAEAEACDKTVIFNDFPSRPLYASLATELVIIFFIDTLSRSGGRLAGVKSHYAKCG